MTEVRLQKFLAAAGVASRRRCEELMRSGRVEVDGEPATRLGLRIDPERAVVRVDGRRIVPPTATTTLVLNKPRGVVSTMNDERGRRDLRSLLPEDAGRLFHVGRLDTDTAGLLLVTDHGELAHRLAHPSYEIAKTYVALVEGRVKPSLASRLRAGIELEDGPARVDAFGVIQAHGDRTLVELTIHMGRNRIVRRLLEEVGHRVVELTRTAFGPVRLRDLRAGAVRGLTDVERGELFDSVGL